MPALIDLTRRKFGRLTVVERNGTDTNGNALWLCVCECCMATFSGHGPMNIGEVTVKGRHLTSGHTQSCGC